MAGSLWGETGTWQEGRAFRHVGAFIVGWVLALGWDVAAMAAVVWHAVGGGAAWRAEFAQTMWSALVGFAWSVGIATAGLLSLLGEADERARFEVNRRYWRTMAVGAGHGAMGAWPVFLAAQWWGQRRIALGIYGAIETAALVWFFAAVLVAAWLAARVARGGPAGRRCPKCGYDLRGSPGRCPECGRVVGKVGTQGSAGGAAPAEGSVDVR